MNNMNGKEFYKALLSGVCKVISRHEHLNKINVFPVPDGDTGTNLLFTLRPIIKIEDDISSHFGEALSLIANTCIDSARGNSGTIMAQYFVGISETCSGYEVLSNENLANLLDAGYTAAKSSMSDPKEGTIISVMRDVIDTAEKQKNEDDISKMLNRLPLSLIKSIRFSHSNTSRGFLGGTETASRTDSLILMTSHYQILD